MKEFITLSKSLSLYMYNVWVWIFALTFIGIQLVSDTMVWRTDYTGGGLTVTEVAAGVALVYTLLSDWINYSKATSVLSKVRRRFTREDNTDPVVQHYILRAFVSVADKAKHTAYNAVHVDVLDREVFEECQKLHTAYKNAEKSIWGVAL